MAKNKVPESIVKTASRKGTGRKQVAVACIHCHQLKVGCDGARPCARCVKRGTCDTCIDVHHGKRGPKSRKDSSAAGEKGNVLDDLMTCRIEYIEQLEQRVRLLERKVEEDRAQLKMFMDSFSGAGAQPPLLPQHHGSVSQLGGAMLFPPHHLPRVPSTLACYSQIPTPSSHVIFPQPISMNQLKEETASSVPY